MRLSNYKSLIKNLPYLDQAFETKKSTWKKEYAYNNSFRQFCNQVFVDEVMKLSRNDLFSIANANPQAAIFSIIFCCYPRNMRGNSFLSILSSIDFVSQRFNVSKEMSTQDFQSLYNGLAGSGIGLSTLSKFLYFFGFTLEGNRCLILDSRIIDVINDGLYEELLALRKITEFNKKVKYMEYINVIAGLAHAEGYKEDQLEFFLFLLGKNLKNSVVTSNNSREV